MPTEEKRTTEQQQLQTAGYGYTPEASNSFPELFLTKKGQEIRVRLCSTPYIFDEDFKGKEDTEVKKRFGFIVIHKIVLNNVPTRQVVAFKASEQIYRALAGLVTDPKWGDPQGYDILITRTEEFGSYYTVAPIEGTKKPLSEVEQEMLKKSGLTTELVYGKRKSEALQSSVPHGKDPFDD